jgi:hypothetical protein
MELPEVKMLEKNPKKELPRIRKVLYKTKKALIRTKWPNNKKISTLLLVLELDNLLPVL